MGIKETKKFSNMADANAFLNYIERSINIDNAKVEYGDIRQVVGAIEDSAGTVYVVDVTYESVTDKEIVKQHWEARLFDIIKDS